MKEPTTSLSFLNELHKAFKLVLEALLFHSLLLNMVHKYWPFLLGIESKKKNIF